MIAALFGKEIDDAIDGLIGAVRMQRAQAQVSGLSERDGMFHGFRVADFTDQNDVGRLPQRILERVMPRVRIDSHLAVRDQGLLRLVDEFHRIFHRNNVSRRRAIAMIDHGRQGGRFTGPGGAYDQNQPAFGHDDIFEDLGQRECRETRDLGRNRANHHPGMLLLNENIDSKPGDLRYRHREIALEFFGELVTLALVHQR